MTAAWPFRITAAHLLDNLANALYDESGGSLMELVRNGVVACMNGEWDASKGFVEIFLGPHKLSPTGKALIVLDHGSGFTDPCIQQFCQIGAALNDNGGKKLHGAAQKRIGRFAAFSLNRICVENNDPTTGFYILTRTQAKGQVKFVTMIPADIERNQGVTPRWIDQGSAEMSNLKGIEGSFSAIIIPNSVFGTVSEIRRALEWRVPRKQDQMFKLLIDGKALHPPEPPTRVTSAQKAGGVEVFIDKAPEGEDAGLWICDAKTGFRVAFAPKLGRLYLPDPFWRRDLVGDIFVPDALANQDTGRIGLTQRFLKGRVWGNAMLYLVGNVASEVKTIIGDTDVFTNNRTRKDLLSFVERCNEVYCEPEDRADGPWFGTTKKDPPAGGTKPSATSRPEGSLERSGGGTSKPKVRTMPFRLGQRTFFLCKRLLDPNILAQVDPSGKVIYFNDSYEALPPTQGARQEHVILQVLLAVGTHDFPSDTYSATLFAAETRRELLGK